MTDARAVIDAATTEADFQWQVVRLAQLNGYQTYHTHDSRHSAAGFPDCVFVHPVRREIIYAELKRTGRSLTPAQVRWRDVLLAAGARYFTWRPEDWLTIEATLKGDA